MAHQHDHPSGKNLRLAFFLNVGFTILEIIGGLITNSVAILSDALHDLGDSLSLGVSWFLDRKSTREANSRFTFGYKRFSLLGALINSLVLIAGSVFVISEALQRLQNPETTDARGMVIFALIGVTVNGYAAWKLSSGKTLNEKVVSWHLVEDVLGWVAVLIVSIVLLFTDWYFLDPALSILITVYVLYNVIRRLRETLYVFLQAKPGEIDLEEVIRKIKEDPKVKSLHHTHLWSLDGEHHVFTTHVQLQDVQSFSEIVACKERLKEMLKREYHFSHYTIETELDQESCSLND
ncbi:MAG TPA: cation transporter [Cryomorphaceae bacterium]|nr:cation transporter [Owenweeksia sp.]MBF98400.1 cation transporter [Owenweeksia sp.]HAD98451.1 cation transporter [Cryomorphaceae bacterium]HBF20430.1 cation transporter [Cryomorphaceae bacterium]HCQ14900.1 cation transporter [Cryomorphaceae bacterium]|tara:strand:- start:10982 stop:11860 length:879 start_codon:yes stop_codon:yes gene_type:complete